METMPYYFWRDPIACIVTMILYWHDPLMYHLLCMLGGYQADGSQAHVSFTQVRACLTSAIYLYVDQYLFTCLSSNRLSVSHLSHVSVSSDMSRAEIDMAFMVLLNLNIEDAVAANATTAEQVMTHLRTLINEQQDGLVSQSVSH